MKNKPGNNKLSFRQLAAMNGDHEPNPGPASPRRPEASAHSDQKTEESRRNLYRQATDYLSVVMTAVREDQRFALEPGYKILEQIVDIRTPMDALFLKSIHSDESYDFVVNHSVNVAIYAIKMAETLGFTRTQQIEMGMVGLFHDIGMAKIPDEIIYKKEKLNDREFHLIKERPKLGYDILTAYGEEFAYLAECTLQIYERADGSGYPRGLYVDEIHEYAQIIGLVDMYEALIHTRPQREKILHFYAVKEIIRSGKRKFQQQYLKALLNTFSIFPIHSYVRLNSNAVGRVIETYRDQPMRPKLQIVYDSQRKRVLTERIINLPEHSLLYITDAVSEDELLNIAEDSYLTSKPSGFDTSMKSDGGAGGDEKQRRKNDRTKSSSSHGRSASPGDRKGAVLNVRNLILVLALVLIIAGALWQYLSASGEQTATAPMNAEKPGLAASIDNSEVSAGSSEQTSTSLPGISSGAKTVAEKLPAVASNSESRVSTTPAADASSSNPEGSFIDSAPPDAAFPYSVKLTYFKTQQEAARAVESYMSSGIDAYWVKVNLGSQGIWYRVFGEQFESLAAANEFIQEHQLSGAVAKNTRYANWIGASEDRRVIKDKAMDITSLGFDPYIIERENNMHHLYVGAFYTVAGVEAQHAELYDKGIRNVMVER
jgi:HD-GYP domain-containing protein (c-di-GMP phosphodiesterase class II)